MTNEEILKKAIEKAELTGWKYAPMLFYTGNTIETLEEKDIAPLLIFNHSFAKAFWGTLPGYYTINRDTIVWTMVSSGNITEWQYHIQQMVLAEDPIKYLEKFL